MAHGKRSRAPCARCRSISSETTGRPSHVEASEAALVVDLARDRGPERRFLAAAPARGGRGAPRRGLLRQPATSSKWMHPRASEAHRARYRLILQRPARSGCCSRPRRSAIASQQRVAFLRKASLGLAIAFFVLHAFFTLAAPRRDLRRDVHTTAHGHRREHLRHPQQGEHDDALTSSAMKARTADGFDVLTDDVSCDVYRQAEKRERPCGRVARSRSFVPVTGTGRASSETRRAVYGAWIVLGLVGRRLAASWCASSMPARSPGTTGRSSASAAARATGSRPGPESRSDRGTRMPAVTALAPQRNWKKLRPAPIRDARSAASGSPARHRRARQPGALGPLLGLGIQLLGGWNAGGGRDASVISWATHRLAPTPRPRRESRRRGPWRRRDGLPHRGVHLVRQPLRGDARLAPPEDGRGGGREHVPRAHVGLERASQAAWGPCRTRASRFRYAHLYYREDSEGSPAAPCSRGEAPSYFDFAYFSFTIGMCFQVSDTTVTSCQIRRTVLAHAMLSFAYSTVILAFFANSVPGAVH